MLQRVAGSDRRDLQARDFRAGKRYYARVTAAAELRVNGRELAEVERETRAEPRYEIRASEARPYQRNRKLFALAADYARSDEATPGAAPQARQESAHTRYSLHVGARVHRTARSASPAEQRGPGRNCSVSPNSSTHESGVDRWIRRRIVPEVGLWSMDGTAKADDRSG